MQERLEVLSSENVIGSEDATRAQFYAACAAAIERLTEQLDRRDRAIELKDERQQSLDREILQLRAAIVNSQRSNEDARAAYNTASTDRQRALDRLGDEVKELRNLRDALRESDAARGALIEKNLALETELARVVRLSKEVTARNEAEIELTRAQIAQVDSMILQIHRSFFWRLKTRLSILRSPLRAVRAAVRR